MNEIEDDDTYEAALGRIRLVFANSSEVIAAFIGYARGGEIPPGLLIEEAGATLDELVRFRSGLRQNPLN